ncbi:glycosyltransferase [Thioclava dalianensis]|uniref:Glycosyltransferase n=1 Tax=Thioclava dalianensis TaxID=1185766 RepID=A0A074TJW3_9RHOB|nr:glycosyltransferase family 4 protein [Thioclava dalianensis]KEP69243.1 glycosyltransferase [Thioclava dalianensis]SFM72772.1 Glycosyltransferase involved in cell wall bisynthesis [Thioclava dalianensis]
MSARLKVLMIAPDISCEATGEAYVAFQWAQALAPLVDLTTASFQDPGHSALSTQLPEARVVTWPRPTILDSNPRLRAMLKPEWPLFMRKVRRYLRAHGAEFDIAHQIMPQAMRYATPLRGAGLPYVIGPLGGGLSTPKAFAAEGGGAKWYTRLRALDHLRLRYDPALRASYGQAALVLGVAPYVRDHLAPIALRDYENVLELGIAEAAPPEARKPREDGKIHLLHVGRGVRTKGLRDVVRALALLAERDDLHLTSAGAGEEIALCRAEAERLGVADRCTFLGAIPRAEVETLYQSADIFVFPSWREPAGNVLYEAMRWGLPVIAAARGGPDGIVEEGVTGLKCAVSTPEALARDVARAIARLADDADLRARLGAGGRAKVLAEGLWPAKAAGLVTLYHRALEAR